MRYQRLIIEAEGNSLTLSLHPRLTVVVGLGRAERDAMTGELLAGLTGTRAGIHIELAEDGGRRLAVLRPSGAQHRVVDLKSGADITGEFLTERGSVDLLSRYLNNYELDGGRRLRLTATDVAAASQSEAIVDALAKVDQSALWSAAERIRQADATLKDDAELVGATAEDAELVEEIEKTHRIYEKAKEREESVRHHALFISTACALGAAPAALISRFATLPFLLVACVTMLIAIRWRMRLGHAKAAVAEKLAEAGSESYLAFHLQRVNGMINDDEHRRRLARAAQEHRVALGEWRALAGDVAVEWALAVRDRVEATARASAVDGTDHAPDRASPSLASAPAEELAQTVIGRLAAVRGSAGRESVPLVLDEPFPGVPATVKTWLGELLVAAAGNPQIIYLTDDADLANWARLESIGGALAVVEPAPIQVVSNDAAVATG